MKNKFGRVLQILVALMLVSAVFVSSMLGTVNADYFKSLSQKLKFEATPDIAWKWYLKDDSKTSSGKINSLDKISASIKITATDGTNCVYYIAIPADEVGIYNLSFVVDFERSDGTDFFTTSTNKPVGCKVTSPNETYYYGGETVYKISSSPTQYTNKNNYESNGNWKWQTLAPSRSESVTLTYKVTQNDIDSYGYVLWMWNFHGLAAGTYTLNITTVSSSKIDEPEANEPYIDFANMGYKNNTILSSTGSTLPTGKSGDYYPTVHKDTVVGYSIVGVTRDSQGKGTYVTQADYNGMTMQAEPLYFGATGDFFWVNSDLSSEQRKSYDYSNPLVFNIPVRNVKKNTTYKVTFDFSVAAQGDPVYETYAHQSSSASIKNYADYTTDLTDFFSNDGPTTLNFQSYLCGTTNYSYRTAGHNGVNGRNYFWFADKVYNQHWSTRYDEITQKNQSQTTALDAIKSNVAGSVNNYYTSDTSNLNWFNAITRTEYNGQNTITWLTFSNTSFSFNLTGDKFTGERTAGSYEGSTDIIETLYWNWCIDAFQPSQWFRIKIENVRIEEVVEFGANVDSITVDGVSYTLDNTSNPYRGASGTGQILQARHYAVKEDPSKSMTQSALHLYAPVYDLTGVNVNSKRIYLSGYCVADGGVDRYVWSADNGKTWYDLKETGLSDASDTQLMEAEYRVDAAIKGENTLENVTGTARDFVTFDASDKNKGNFVSTTKNGVISYKMYVDLTGTKFEHQPDIDIIIAAVPRHNINLRCEIFKVINFNSVPDYVSQIDYIASDIQVSDAHSTRTFLPNNLVVAKDSDKSSSSVSMSELIGRRQNSSISDLSNVGVYYHRKANTEFCGYENLRTLYTGIPIKRELTIAGRAVLRGGIKDYAYSVDNGVTWTSLGIEGVKDYTASTGLTDGGATTCTKLHEKLIFTWLTTSVSSNKNAYWFGDNTHKDNNGLFDTTAPLKIDLSAYAGQTIDVIVGAKSSTGAYCPIAKLDNVAVYGDASTDAPNDRGTFYTRVESIKINDTAVPSVTTDVFGATMSHANWGAALNLEGTAITSLEPYHTNIISTRMYNNVVNQIPNGGKVTVEGFTICKNGVNRYLYSLDGGKTWNTIDTAVCVDAASNFINAGKKIDSGFELTDTNGDGRTDIANAVYRSDKEGGKLEFNLPEQEIGSEKYLLIVAESNANTDVNGDGSFNDPSGKYYPVSQIKIKIVAG